MDMCSSLLHFLTSRGCLLADITPELLLPPAEFRKWRQLQFQQQLQV
jgi:hypothetical protein